MSNKNVALNNKIVIDNKPKEEENQFKNKIDLNRIKTIISVKINDNNEKTKPESGNKESSEMKKSQNNNKFSLSKIKSIKKTLIKSSYLFLTYLGNPKEAEIHRNANSILKKVGEWSDKTIFCQCCGHACKEDGVMEEYKYSDSTDEFIQNGQAIPLYFSFYLYSILILSISFLVISLPCLIISNNRSDELNKVCNKIYNKNIIIDECKIYLDHANNTEDENKNNFNFILDFSVLNIKNYRVIHSILTSNKNDNLDNIFVNFSILNFIGIWTILLIYFGYIVLINNRAYLPEIDILSPKNYSIMITGMDGFFSFLRTKTNYLSIVKEPDNKEKNTNDVKQSSERDSIDEKTIKGAKTFENLFKEKISEIFLDDKKKYNIQKVNVCFKINKFIELEEKLDKCEEIINLIHSPYQKRKNINVEKSERVYYYSPLSDLNIHICERSKKLSDVKKEKREIEKQLNELLEETNEINMDKFAGAVIVSFNTAREKEEFLSQIPNTLFLKLLKMISKLRYFFCFCCIDKIDNTKFIMKHLKINIEEAPNPEDIIFENLEFTPKEKAYRVVGINMISLVLIAIGFALILGLQDLQIYVNKKDYNKIIYYLISLSITIVSSIINIIFEELLDMLTKHEKQSSVGNYYLSYSVKLTIFSFLIKGVIPLVVENILGTTNYENLITNMFIMFLANSIFTPLTWTFNISPNYLKKKLAIHLIQKDSSKYLNLNQKKLNELYEKSDMKIAEKYSYIAKTLLMTFLYISIFPFGVLISLGGFIICYFLEKYNFINNYKRPEVLNNSLFFFYMKNYVIFLFCIGVGDYIFLSDVFSSKAWSLVNIIFLGILIVIPFNYFLKQDFIGLTESSINNKTYEDAYLDFDQYYERINPMTKEEGDKYFVEKLYEKKLIDKKQKENYLKDIKKINLMKIYYEHRKNRNKSKIQKRLVASISKSFLPNQKNFFKLSKIYNSTSDLNNQNKPKTFVNQSQMVNQMHTKNKLGQNNILLLNEEDIKSTDKMNNKRIIKKIEEIKEVESNQEEEKESEIPRNKLNKAIRPKKEGKSVKIDINKSIRNVEMKFKDFYENPIMYKLCGSVQVFDFFTRDREKDDENNYFDNDDNEDEKEELYSLDNNDIEELNIYDNNSEQ